MEICLIDFLKVHVTPPFTQTTSELFKRYEILKNRHIHFI